MSDGREFASEEERWGALRGEGVEAAAPDGWEPDEGEDGGFEEEIGRASCRERV